MRKKYLQTVESMVIQILRDFPKSRDSDTWLVVKLWCVFYPSRIIREEGKGPMIKLEDIMELPKEDQIKRIRASIQNHPTNPRYLPTSLEIVKRRHINEDTWKEYIRGQK